MNTRELIEMASLDVLGLLDDDERRQFETAFRAAKPHVQAQVRRHQLRYTEISDLLPDVEPPPGLRGRVVRAVRSAVDSFTSQEADETTGVLGRVGFGKFLNYTPVWRAACIGFASSSLVLGWFAMNLFNETRRTHQMISQEQITEQIHERYGIDFTRILANANNSTRILPLVHQAPDIAPENRARGTIVADPAAGLTYISCVNLPEASGEYEIVVEPDNEAGMLSPRRRGEIIATNGQVTGRFTGFRADEINRLAIVPKGSNEVILKVGDI